MKIGEMKCTLHWDNPPGIPSGCAQNRYGRCIVCLNQLRRFVNLPPTAKLLWFVFHDEPIIDGVTIKSAAPPTGAFDRRSWSRIHVEDEDVSRGLYTTLADRIRNYATKHCLNELHVQIYYE